MTINKPTDFFSKMCFRPSQLIAIKKIFDFYIEPNVRDFNYTGSGIAISWKNNISETSFKSNYDKRDNIIGYNFSELANDTLWNEFKDILPYMNKDASLTIMPSMTMMVPHVDRPYRPTPIYFPISGCTPNCYSDCYDLHKIKERGVRNWTHTAHTPIYSYNIIDNAYMMNSQEWHGVRNYSKQRRIVFGWNTAGDESRKTYSELRDIFTKLGYING